MSVSEVKKINSENELKIAFVADDMANIDIYHDSTFALMCAASELKFNIFFTEDKNLKIVNNQIVAKFNEVNAKKDPKNHFQVISSTEYSLDFFNIIFARKDPPVNEEYIAYLQMLSMACQSTKEKPLIINSPEGMLRANEKLYALNFPELIPPTLVSLSKTEILEFLTEHKEAVIKPLFTMGGEGVHYLNIENKKSLSVIENSLNANSHVLVQKYLPEVKNGDKRIMLLNGVPLGGISRIPKEGEFRANMGQGGTAKPYKLSQRDLEICEILKPFLEKDELYFTGIDLIGDYLIEVNVTSPTCLQEVERFDKKQLAKEIIQWAVNYAMTVDNTKIKL